jgi:hypothetical protein
MTIPAALWILVGRSFLAAGALERLALLAEVDGHIIGTS